MKANDKIQVKEYLNYLNGRVDYYCKYKDLNKNSIFKLTCKDLSNLCDVTPATISNLTTSSKYILINKIASAIMDAYFPYFIYDELQAKKENPDETIYPRDINYIIMYLTNYFTESFLNFR